jgi:hypothetical protein
MQESVDLLSRRAAPDLATKYSRAADFELGIDLYEDNPFSNFVSKLLDSAHKLQAQLQFADQEIARLNGTIRILESEEKDPGLKHKRSSHPLVSPPVTTELI